MDELNQDVNPESSPESTPEPNATPQSGAPTAPPQAPEPPFHQHPRFRELTGQNRELKQQIAQLSQAMRQFQQQQQRPTGSPMSPEDQVKYREAAQSLRLVLQQDPELARLLTLAQRAPQYDQSFQSMSQLQAQNAQAHNTAARNTVKELCAADKLPTDAASLKRITALVATEAMSLEDGDKRFEAGDMSVLEEAFANLKPLLSALRKPAEDTLLNTKNKVRNLPQRSNAGTPAGPPGIGKPERGNERAYESKLAELAKKMLGD